MKKPQLHLLIFITGIFVAFTLGFFLGRNQNHDQVQISIPREMMTQPLETTAHTEETHLAEASTEPDWPLNINSAELWELMCLPGIGEIYAQRIIDYRETHGDFRTVEELLNVTGIGEKRLEAILDYITAGG